MGEIFGVRCRKRVWVYSERVFGLFRGEETLPRKGVACSMERVRGGRIGSLRPVSERALAGRGSPALVSGAACGAGRLCTGRLHVRGYRLHRDLLPVAGRSAGRVSCGGRCRLRRGLLLRMGGACGLGIPVGGRVVRVGGRRCPYRAVSGAVLTR